MALKWKRSRKWSTNRDVRQERQDLSPPRAEILVGVPSSCVAEMVAQTPKDDGDGAITDDQILDAAYYALNGCGYGQLRTVIVDCNDGRITLRGRVPTYYLKQVAQTAVHRVDGIRGIDNNLQVVTPR